MRRRAAAFVVAALSLGLLFASPWSAQAEQEPCDDRRITVMTGNKNVGWVDPGGAGCTAGANQNTRRILPGADSAKIRASRGASKFYPLVATVVTDTKTAEFDLVPDTQDDPAKASRYETTDIPIGSTSKLVVKVTYSNGSVRETTYTR
jgi:hypothetical protein